MYIVIDKTESFQLPSTTLADLTSWLSSNLPAIANSDIRSAYLALDEWIFPADADYHGFRLEVHRQGMTSELKHYWLAVFTRNDQMARIDCHLEPSARSLPRQCHH